MKKYTILALLGLSTFIQAQDYYYDNNSNYQNNYCPNQYSNQSNVNQDKKSTFSKDIISKEEKNENKEEKEENKEEKNDENKKESNKKEEKKEPERRALPAPFESPPFPSGEYQGYPLVGVPPDDTELLERIRQSYPKEWSEDWKNDVFLGDAFYMTMKYDERHEAYKRAYEKLIDPPPALLISLASCYLSPGSPITLEQAENLAKKALEEEMSIEGVILLRGIYAEKKDQAKFDYWDKILKELEEKQIHAKDIWPDIHS